MAAPEHDTPEADPLAPVRPHDALTLDELATHYNFRLTSDRRSLFVRCILEFLTARPEPRAALDIGCGEGLGQSGAFLTPIRDAVADLQGLEPDPNVEVDDRFDRVERALMEDADLPENHFDVAYAMLVMEHVADPERFMAAVHRCLKPGGAFLFLTPNRRHYFTVIAHAAKRLGIAETALRLVRPAAAVDDYHYPVVYRFNRPEDILPIVEPLGFTTSTFAYVEEEGPRPYFPGPLRPLYLLMRKKRELIRTPNRLLDLVGRLEKA